MQRRRFLALGAGLLVAATGCLPRDLASESPEATDGGASDGTANAPAKEPRPTPPPTEPPSGSSSDHEEPSGGADQPDQDEGPDGTDEPDPGEGSDDGSPATQPDPDDYPSAAEEWGERVTGVRSRLPTDEPDVALTFDACGGPGGSGYDEALVELLISEEVPATLFLNKRWIEANQRTFRWLAEQPQFEIANHGSEHVPLSVEGRSAYGIPGTAGPGEVIEEVTANQELIERLTGQRPRHFRPGTAYCDDVAVRIVGDMGLEVVGFDIAGDAGATFASDQVTAALAAAQPGSIALLHMNHPGSGTLRGVADAIPRLRDQGLAFAKLGQYL